MFFENVFFIKCSPCELLIVILTSPLRLGLPKGLFPVGLPGKILKTVLPSWLRDLPSQPYRFNHPDNIR